jgi:hypothetical protein
MVNDTGQYRYVEALAVRNSVFMNEYNIIEAENNEEISVDQTLKFESFILR